MGASACSVALSGVEGVLVRIDAAVTHEPAGEAAPDAAGRRCRALRQRVFAAIRHTDAPHPTGPIRLAITPTNENDLSTGIDLAVAAAVLAATAEVPAYPLGDTVLLGGLSPDGRLRAQRGVLPALLAARRAGYTRAIVPADNVSEAALVPDIAVHAATHLDSVLRWLRGDTDALPRPPLPGAARATDQLDLADVPGQPQARWALEVAAAGGHSLLFVGPLGSGRTLLAERLPGLLPPLSVREQLEVTALHSVAGLLGTDDPLITAPPFIAPHYTTSMAALVGGGSGPARPGALSRAHRGVLFLDELPEFGPHRLNAVRTGLDHHELRHARRDRIVRFPAAFQLIAAAAPCPCAAPLEQHCSCTPRTRAHHRGRLAAPLADRLDIRVHLAAPDSGARLGGVAAERTATVAARVADARQRATRRWATTNATSNAAVPASTLRAAGLPSGVTEQLESAHRVGALSARGVDAVLRLAWTLADLAEADRPQLDDVAAALDLRRARPSR